MTRAADSKVLAAERESVGLAGSNRRRLLAAAGLALALVVAVVLSLAVGARALSVGEVMKALTDFTGTEADVIVRDTRWPRTLVGLIVGPALGLCGALIQGFTRNPLADPGILGVNAGASFALVVGATFLGLTGSWGMVLAAMTGALAVTVLVYLIGSVGGDRATPAKLTMTGVAISAVLGGLTSAIVIKNRSALDLMRFWGVGSLGSRATDVTLACGIVVAVGVVVALACARPLNSLGLGDELAVALGVRLGLVRTVVIVAVTLLAGAAVALAGPIGFVGLMVPHVVRWFTGPDQRWILGLTVLAAPTLLLASDVLGRVILGSGELRAGLVTAVIGAPVLIMLVRRKNVSGL